MGAMSGKLALPVPLDSLQMCPISHLTGLVFVSIFQALFQIHFPICSMIEGRDAPWSITVNQLSVNSPLILITVYVPPHYWFLFLILQEE